MEFISEGIFRKFLFTPSDSTFVTPSTIFFFLIFPFIKKIFLQTLVEMIFRYHKKQGNLLFKTNYIKWVKTSWTDSIYLFIAKFLVILC